MALQVSTDSSCVDWQIVADTLRKVGMACFGADVHRRAFERSHIAVFVYEDSRLLGFGRATSDGEYQAAIYDVAVIPEAQGKGIGKRVMQTMLEHLSGCNVILYAAPGMEEFYGKLGFCQMTTGMALFRTPEAMKKFTVCE